MLVENFVVLSRSKKQEGKCNHRHVFSYSESSKSRKGCYILSPLQKNHPGI